MVYLIHFAEKLHRAQHYLGLSVTQESFEKRIECHVKNRGARILRAVNANGIDWKVVRVWPESDGNFERTLKNKKKASILCPVCNKSIVIPANEIKIIEAINKLHDRGNRIRQLS